jgi:hypothetical protein
VTWARRFIDHNVDPGLTMVCDTSSQHTDCKTDWVVAVIDTDDHLCGV